MKRISLVIPVFNEEQSINRNLAVILKEVSVIPNVQFDVLLIDDGSTDQTVSKINAFKENDPRVKVLSFTRNFGKEAAVVAGLHNTSGQAVIVMDSDLQHPPHLIVKMLQHWLQGFKVVEAVKEDRGKESAFSRLSASFFYLILKTLSGQSLAGHSDFKLLDREVVDAYLALPEKHKFFRGLVHWLGYDSVQLFFTVPERQGDGGSRWSKVKLFKYALINITLFSSAPLRFVGLLGFITLLFGAVFGVISLKQKIDGEALTGFTTVNLLIVVMGGAILCCLGIVGHYLALIYDEIKARPPFVIKQKDTN